MKNKIFLFLVLFLLLFSVTSYAAVPYTFTNGTVADATEINSNTNYFENKFSTTSGHDHDGADSKTITTLGTISSGTWQGSIIDEAYGGTGQNTYASGDLLWATSSDTLARLAIGSYGSLLMADVSTGQPAWLTTGTNESDSLFSRGSDTNPAWGGPVAIGNFTRDMTAASGSQSYTGIGFRPKAVILIGTLASGDFSIGFSQQTAQGQSMVYGTTPSYDNAGQTIWLTSDQVNAQYASVGSLDRDGFTLSWTKTASPTGTGEISYMAFR